LCYALATRLPPGVAIAPGKHGFDSPRGFAIPTCFGSA